MEVRELGVEEPFCGRRVQDASLPEQPGDERRAGKPARQLLVGAWIDVREPPPFRNHAGSVSRRLDGRQPTGLSNRGSAESLSLQNPGDLRAHLGGYQPGFLAEHAPRALHVALLDVGLDEVVVDLALGHRALAGLER